MGQEAPAITYGRGTDRLAPTSGDAVGEMLVVGLTHLQLHTAQIRTYLVTRGVPWVGK